MSAAFPWRSMVVSAPASNLANGESRLLRFFRWLAGLGGELTSERRGGFAGE